MKKTLSCFGAALLGVVFLGVTLVTPEVHSQEVSSQGPPPAIFVETIDVEIVNIDVYVTHKDGTPVHGLTKEDFLLFVDGKPATVSNFYATSAAREKEPLEPESSSDASAEDLSAEDSQPTNEPEKEDSSPAPIPPDQQLHVVVYIDNFNLTPFNRNRVMRELRTFLTRELDPQDRVMLASYDRSLHVRQPFTTDRRVILQAMLDLETVSAQRIHRNGEREELFQLVLDVNIDRPQLALSQLYAYAGSVRNDMHFTIDALASIVDNLAGSPGRKAVVYVSDGIPMIAGEDMFTFIDQTWENLLSLNEMTEYDNSRRIQQLANKANANRVSFYTIDARGLTVLSQGTVAHANAGAPGQQAMIDSIWRHNLQSPLQMMADETGGRAIINANRILPDLLKIASDFKNYYSLGYAPLSGGGRYHRIEVKLKERLKGVTVRHRSGYRTKSVEARMIDGTYSALHLDLQDNPLEARLLFGPSKPRPDGNFDIPISVRIPFEKLTLIEREGVYIGQLRLWLAAKDQDDRATEPKAIPIDIRIPSDRIGETVGEDYSYIFELQMEEGFHHVAIGLRDDFGAQDAFLRRGVNVGRN